MRIRFEGKVFQLNFDENSTINDLQNSIRTLTKNENLRGTKFIVNFFYNILVLYKFPLVELDMTDPSRTLKSSGIESLETLTLEPQDQIIKMTRGIMKPKPSYIILREIPDDNSCLFNAIGYVLENKALSKAQYLRDSNMDYKDHFLKSVF